MKINALFTYGTLMQGEKANHYLRGIKGSWQGAYVFGRWINNDFVKYPIIKLDIFGEKIMGELFCSDQLANIIKILDEYEGPKYKRSISRVYLKDNSVKLAYVYELA